MPISVEEIWNAQRKNVAIALVYLLIALAFFWPILEGKILGTGGDAYQSLWELWWVPYSIFSLHSSPYFSNYVFYPVGANLVTQTLAPIAGIISIPFQLFGLQVAEATILLISFALSGLFMYMLSLYLTKNKVASFLAGFIFAFAPIHVAHSLGQLNWMTVEFMPLFLLFFLKMLNERKQKFAVYAGISLVFLTFMGDIEQLLIMAVTAFFMIVYMLIRKEERKALLNTRSLLLLGEMLATFLILGSPAIIPIIHGLSSTTFKTANAQATTAYNELYSPDLLSYFTPSLNNGLLRSIPLSNARIYKGNPGETTTYAGYIVMAVAAYAVYVDYKKDRLRKTGMFVFVLFFVLWLSVGPYLWVDGSLTHIPGIFLVYHKIPLLYVMPAAFAILLIEYFAMPVSNSMVAAEYSSAHIPKAYIELGELPGKPSIAILPNILNTNNAQPNLYPGIAMYYQTVFKKPIIGGYTSRENATQLFSLTNVPLFVSAYYLELGQGLVYASPIIENYTNATKFLLAAYNVSFIGVVKQAYTMPELMNLTSYLYSVFGDPVYNSNTTIMFSTNKALANAANSTVAYAPIQVGGTATVWVPGWLLCSYQACNSTVSKMWWGVRPAFIEIYAPKVENLKISFKAMSYPVPSSAYIYFDGAPAYVANLSLAPKNITFNVTAIGGINPLLFVSGSNATSIGIDNFTYKI